MKAWHSRFLGPFGSLWWIPFRAWQEYSRATHRNRQLETPIVHAQHSGRKTFSGALEENDAKV